MLVVMLSVELRSASVAATARHCLTWPAARLDFSSHTCGFPVSLTSNEINSDMHQRIFELASPPKLP